MRVVVDRLVSYLNPDAIVKFLSDVAPLDGNQDDGPYHRHNTPTVVDVAADVASPRHLQPLHQAPQDNMAVPCAAPILCVDHDVDDTAFVVADHNVAASCSNATCAAANVAVVHPCSSSPLCLGSLSRHSAVRLDDVDADDEDTDDDDNDNDDIGCLDVGNGADVNDDDVRPPLSSDLTSDDAHASVSISPPDVFPDDGTIAPSATCVVAAPDANTVPMVDVKTPTSPSVHQHAANNVAVANNAAADDCATAPPTNVGNICTVAFHSRCTDLSFATPPQPASSLCPVPVAGVAMIGIDDGHSVVADPFMVGCTAMIVDGRHHCGLPHHVACIVCCCLMLATTVMMAMCSSYHCCFNMLPMHTPKPCLVWFHTTLLLCINATSRTTLLWHKPVCSLTTNQLVPLFQLHCS